MLILPTLLKAAGSAIGVFGQLSSANALESTANLNFEIDKFNAQQSRQNTLTGLRLDRIGTSIQSSAAKANLSLALAESDAQRRNAERLRQFAEARTKSGREAVRRKMRGFEEFQSSQRAAIGGSGVTASGSALEVMAESAAQFQLSIQDANDEANYERNATLDEAAMQEFGANQGGTRARAEFGMAQRGKRLSQTANKLGRLSAQTAFQSAVRQAEMRRLSGMDQAAGQRLSAVGSILGGAAQFIGDNDKFKYLEP